MQRLPENNVCLICTRPQLLRMDIFFLNGKLKSKGNLKLAGIFLVGITNQRLPKTRSKNVDCSRESKQTLPKTLPKHEVRFLKSKQTLSKTQSKNADCFRESKQTLSKTLPKHEVRFLKSKQTFPKTLPKHEVRFLKSKQTFPKTLPKYEGRFRATDVFFSPSYLLGLKSSK